LIRQIGRHETLIIKQDTAVSKFDSFHRLEYDRRGLCIVNGGKTFRPPKINRIVVK
jgi:hypothetical protein